ncbi:Vga family ABC-F type ribosomal protection protein [Paraliobacillus salinarum]|uniref:Vga family ABC-F type ribosomal protection protein n=1 Tax=Paraliobacillus salinarum TaxID=1158996 RepID=UPI0015F55D89|nr:Vga family ABC-F type ribosomal protection protein [Paraliobacillus salinarum]
MLLFEVQDIKHYVRDRLLLDINHLQIHHDDRIGLVGRNGCGKTTLLQIISGKITSEEMKMTEHTSSELLPQLKPTGTTKSGGEVTQEYIQQMLSGNAELLLVDEPTTNLDTDHIEWLEKKLKGWPGACVIVSHDRAFLDALCTTIWEIEEGKLTEYKGNYSDYVNQKDIEKRQRKFAYEKYEREKKQLEEAIKLKEKKAQRATKTPKKVSKSEAKIAGAKPYFAKKQKKLQKTAASLETRLEKLEKVEKVKELPSLKMHVPNEETFKNRIIIRAEDVSGRVNERLLWDKTSFHVQGGDKLAIIGPNGSGKTSLIRKIINQKSSITVSPSVKIGYFSQNLNILADEKSILENVQSSSKQSETLIRTVLARLRFFNEDVYKRVDVLSGGERVKVALAKLFVSDINTLILDEPTNFLDIEAVEELESLLQAYEGSVIFVSHDRQFVENIATRILEVRNQTIHVFEGNYQAYKQSQSREKQDTPHDDYLLLETKISEVLSRLSLEPSEELEKEFQRLLKQKRELEK